MTSSREFLPVTPTHQASVLCRAWRWALLLSIIGSTAIASRVQAQASQGRTPVLIVVADSIPGGGRALIERYASGARREVILLSFEGSTARQLSAAVFTLVTARAATGTTVSQDQKIRVSSTAGPTAWIETEERTAERVVRRLHRARPHFEPGYGLVRTTDITIPTDALMGRLQQR
jgi:hypothetical protein